MAKNKAFKYQSHALLASQSGICPNADDESKHADGEMQKAYFAAGLLAPSEDGEVF